MAPPRNESTEKNSSAGSVFSKIFETIAAVKLFFGEMRNSVLENVDWFLRRVEYLFIVYLWISVGVLFLVLGIFDLVIDLGRVPRGVVFSIGGVIIFLTAVIFSQAAKIKKKK
jgi:hypothetical protein